MNNGTTIYFLGFQKVNLQLFIFLLTIYCWTICGNALIITLVSINKALHSPMYFFISQLSTADIILTTDVAPNMLNIVLHEQTSISLTGCFTQYFLFAFSFTYECFLLTIMSYDRYLAICSPLHYASIMDRVLCVNLSWACWLLSPSVPLLLTLSLRELQFCGPNIIDHFLCDFIPLIELSCSDTSIVQMESTLLGFPVVIIPFLLIVVSYVYIILAILKMPSLSGKQKTFSTCSSHLTVVSIFDSSLFAMYVVPNQGKSHAMSKILTMFYTVFSPFINPFIYSLRNKDIKDALRNIFKQKFLY